MTNNFSDLDDLPTVEDHPESPAERDRRIARRKPLPMANRNKNPGFNGYPRAMTRERKEWLERTVSAVRQPERIGWMQHPTKPPQRRRETPR